MKKLNNQGFAITGVMYAILVLFLVLLVSILGLLASRKIVLDKLKGSVANQLNQTPTLIEIITKNKVTTGPGLYQLSNTEYRYRGNLVNNYIQIGEYRYRIISIDNQGIKIMTENKLTDNRVFDTGSNTATCDATTCPRNTNQNTYCQITSGNYYGCNAYAMVGGTYTTPTKSGTVTQNSSLYDYLNSTGTDPQLMALRNVARNVTWHVGPVAYNTASTLAAIQVGEQSITLQFSVGLLNPSDYIQASLENTCQTNVVGNVNCKNENWLFNTEYYYPWLLNGYSGNTYEMGIINTNTGYIGYNTSYASNSYGIIPVGYIPIDSLFVSGTGTLDNPYLFRV